MMYDTLCPTKRYASLTAISLGDARPVRRRRTIGLSFCGREPGQDGGKINAANNDNTSGTMINNNSRSPYHTRNGTQQLQPSFVQGSPHVRMVPT